MKNSELWVLEWSQRANVFHVQRLDTSLGYNRKLYRENTSTSNDYRILVVGTHDECSAAADASRQTLIGREPRHVEVVL